MLFRSSGSGSGKRSWSVLLEAREVVIGGGSLRLRERYACPIPHPQPLIALITTPDTSPRARTPDSIVRTLCCHALNDSKGVPMSLPRTRSTIRKWQLSGVLQEQTSLRPAITERHELALAGTRSHSSRCRSASSSFSPAARKGQYKTDWLRPVAGTPGPAYTTSWEIGRAHV